MLKYDIQNHEPDLTIPIGSGTRIQHFHFGALPAMFSKERGTTEIPCFLCYIAFSMYAYAKESSITDMLRVVVPSHLSPG
jgi:hypothetical protein